MINEKTLENASYYIDTNGIWFFGMSVRNESYIGLNILTPTEVKELADALRKKYKKTLYITYIKEINKQTGVASISIGFKDKVTFYGDEEPEYILISAKHFNPKRVT